MTQDYIITDTMYRSFLLFLWVSPLASLSFFGFLCVGTFSPCVLVWYLQQESISIVRTFCSPRLQWLAGWASKPISPEGNIRDAGLHPGDFPHWRLVGVSREFYLLPVVLDCSLRHLISSLVSFLLLTRVPSSRSSSFLPFHLN